MVTQEEEFSQKYPEKEYTKRVYSFTQEEKGKLQSLNTIVQIGQIAQVMINQFIQNSCLKRVEVKNSPDIGVLYDIPTGNFFVFTPKEWCSQCGVRKAEYQYKGKRYCKDCLTLLQSQEKVEAMKKEAKK